MARDLTMVWRHGGRGGQLAVGSLAACLAVLCAAGATFSMGPASDTTSLPAAPVPADQLPAVPVPADQLPAINSAALSCPALTPARIAAQIMAATAFDPRSTTPEGGTGVAGLTDAIWRQWAPGPEAPRSDVAANILAMAHVVCDLSGHVRAAGVPGDAWRSALAAFHSGLNEVVSVRGVPAGATGYVNTVAAYAQWYARRPEFGGTGDTGSPSPSVLGAPVAAASPSPVAGTTQQANRVDPANGWRLTWSDEFNGPAGSAVDAGKWSHDTGGGGWGNSEREYYTTGTTNAALDGAGHLSITARNDNASGLPCWYGACQYTSARLVTLGHFAQTYGRISARIKFPRGNGIWPSFIAFGDNMGSVGWPQSGELNVTSAHGNTPATAESGLIGPNYNRFGTQSLSSGTFADGYHTFTADWYPDHISFFVDDRLFDSQYRAGAGSGWVFDHPFYLVLDVAVGGNQLGDPDETTIFPQQLSIDWVKVYRAGPPTASVSGPITGLGGKCVETAVTANGSATRLHDCTGAADQAWTLGTDGTLRLQGKCLVSPAATNSAPAQLGPCTGARTELWQAQTNGALVNIASERCLDATDKSGANGTPLQLWDCWGTENQVWTVR